MLTRRKVQTSLRVNPCITVVDVKVCYKVVVLRRTSIERIGNFCTVNYLVAKRIIEENVEIEIANTSVEAETAGCRRNRIAEARLNRVAVLVNNIFLSARIKVSSCQRSAIVRGVSRSELPSRTISTRSPSPVAGS